MIAAIIQARMGSTRLPGKTLATIMGKPLLWHLLERLKSSKTIEEIVVATTTNPKDKAIVDFSRRYGVEVFQGDENDVLDRMYRAAKKINADAIVRVTPDCPLICPEIIDKVVSEFLKGGYDYVTNTLLYSYPDGCDVEVFTFKALEKAWKEASDPAQREHVTPYIRNSVKFKIRNVENTSPVDPRKFKWSVDTGDDLAFVKRVFAHLYPKNKEFSYKEIMSLLKAMPEIKKINHKSLINEGYYFSFLKSPAVKPGRVTLSTSFRLKNKAEKVIPGCSQTFSKGPSQFVQKSSPVFLEKGKGSHVWDVDSNEYIDYAMALGPIILGHNFPSVTAAVKKVLSSGSIFSLPHRFEYELSELLCEIIPCAEMVRFGKNGSDATSGAVRVSRAFTGRDKIACCGYHGWQDWYIATTARNKGIPAQVKKLTLTFEYNKIASLEKIFSEHKNEIACVIMEPVGVVEPEDNFLQRVKDLTHKNGAVLIFDEVVTGFRLALGGAQEYFKVIPDIACVGKAMGNGYPVSALVGKKEIMKLFEEVFFSFTFGGEIISLAAAIATIKTFREKKVIPHIWEQGRKIRDGYNVLAAAYGLDGYTSCVGLPPRTVVNFKDLRGQNNLYMKSLFQQECIRRGILFTGGHNVCFSHSNEDIDYTLRVYRTVFEILKNAIRKNNVRTLIKGVPLQPIFRKA